MKTIAGATTCRGAIAWKDRSPRAVAAFGSVHESMVRCRLKRLAKPLPQEWPKGSSMHFFSVRKAQTPLKRLQLAGRATLRRNCYWMLIQAPSRDDHDYQAR
jgi:hypothetical protein